MAQVENIKKLKTFKCFDYRDNHETEDEIEELREKALSKSKHQTFKERFQSQLRVAQSKSFWKPFLIAEPLIILYSCSGNY